MLKNYLGDGTKTNITCVRCCREAIACDSSNKAVACVNGHIQCIECDASMKHHCKKCGVPTTFVLQHAGHMGQIDPKTLPPEDLTQLELNAALKHFKIKFQKHSEKKKPSRLIEITSHIIELLNPSYIEAYKKAKRYDQLEIEEHFYRSCGKMPHTFAWHTAALDFVVDRIFDVKALEAMANERIVEAWNEDFSLDHNQHHRHSQMSLDLMEKYAQLRQSKTTKKKKKRQTFDPHVEHDEANVTNVACQTQTNYYEPERLILDLNENTPLITMRPNQWLTEANCPHCGLSVRLSDFSKHFAIYHCLPIECMELGESRRVSLDARVMHGHGGESYPHTLFLIKHIVRDLGGSDFRHFFPIALITATMQQQQQHHHHHHSHHHQHDDAKSMENSFHSYPNCGPKQLMIWLSSISTNDELKVRLNLVNEHSSTTTMTSAKTAKTGSSLCPPLKKFYPITASQNLHEIYKSGKILLLPSNTFGILKKNGLERILLEISLQESKESHA